ncbi:hypothetical protein HMPREF0043_01725 [Actinobaculum sp. oral taxon 183 str. F0552]|nr:hypothetical protein HMPREF0043_01725 [Actinobaculum sp. oral taxon 183 str. F0552]
MSSPRFDGTGDRFDPLSGDADVVSSVRGIGRAQRCLQSSRGARSVLTSFGGYASAILAGRRLPDSLNRPRWGRKIRPIDPGGVGNCQARNGGSEDFVVSDCAALDRNRVE